jgi:GT2 family glycosyltransferase
VVNSDVLISVIVPVRDDPGGVRELLDRLATQTLPQDRFEIVIGDDGSAPGSLSEIATTDGRIRVLSGPPKTSYAARNRAARAARGSFLAFCDADCRPEPDWLERGLEALATADVVAGEVIFIAPDKPSVWSLLTIDMFLDQQRNVRFSRAVTANLLMHRRVFDDLDGFDESLPSGGDYEFTRRAASHGATLVHAPAAIVRHPTLDSARSFLRKVWFTNHWSAVRKARMGLRPELTILVQFIPFVGVALARRNALRPVATLCRPRLVSAGLEPGWRDDARAMPVLYLLVAYVAGAARVPAWLKVIRMSRASRAGATEDRASPPAANRSVSQPRRSGMLASHRVGALPNLVVIGSQKCGTQSLHYYLGVHPEIFMSHQKELDFFIEEHSWHRGPGWYRRQFKSSAPVRGESSPNYSAFPRYEAVPKRMASLVPEARLIYLVRDPLERIASHWVHNYARRRERGDIRATLRHPETSYLARSCYYRQLELFLEHYDASQILVLDSADLRHRRLFTLRRVFEFLQVDSDIYHPRFDRLRHDSSGQRRITRVERFARSTWVGRRVLGPLRGAVEFVLGSSSTIQRPTLAAVREALGDEAINLLRDDADRLRAQTGLVVNQWSIFDETPGALD